MTAIHRLSLVAALMIGAGAWGAGDYQDLKAVPNQCSPPADRRAALKDLLRSVEKFSAISFPSQKDKDDYTALVDRLDAQFPEEPATLFWKADVLERTQRLPEAVRLWTKVLGIRSRLLEGEDADVHSRCCERLAYVRLSEFDADGAEEMARQAVKLAPRNAKNYHCLLDVSFRTGRLDETIRAVKAAAEQYGDAAPAIRTLYHEFLAKVGDWSALRAALAEQPPEKRRPEDDDHFHARLAEIDGKPREAFLYHCTAFLGGPADQPTVRRSKEYIDKVRNSDESKIPDSIRPLALALSLLDRNDAAARAQALDALKPFHSHGGAEERLVFEYLQARAITAKNQDALPQWRAIVKTFPRFAPGLCGLAESLEAAGADQTEIQSLFDKAQAIEPTNWKVREIFRLGVRLRPVAEGAEALEVERDSPWHRFGLRKGDVLLSLDERTLANMPIIERMSALRLFQGGGSVGYLDAASKQRLTRDMELVLFTF